MLISFRTFALDNLESKWQGTFYRENFNSTVTWVFSNQTYMLDFENDGSFEVTGRWEMDEDHLYLWDTRGPLGCRESQHGKYTIVI